MTYPIACSRVARTSSILAGIVNFGNSRDSPVKNLVLGKSVDIADIRNRCEVIAVGRPPRDIEVPRLTALLDDVAPLNDLLSARALRNRAK